MSNVNNFDFIGRLAKDPTAVPTANQSTGYFLTIAVEKVTKDRHTNERKTIVDWIPLVIFREATGRYVMDNLRKGDLIYANGSVRTRKAFDENGQEYSEPSFRVNIINRLQQAQANRSNDNFDHNENSHYGQGGGYQNHNQRQDLPPNY